MALDLDALRGAQKKLLELGVMYPVFAGIQIDLNAVYQRTMPTGSLVQLKGRKQVSFCDHNCTKDVGGYDCPAARSKHKHVEPRTVPPPEVILSWIDMAITGLQQARDQFLTEKFDHVCLLNKIVNPYKMVIHEGLRSQKVEVNLFGGNPELYEEILVIIHALKTRGVVVNLTTTGYRFLREPDFLERFLVDPPNMLALSVDDIPTYELDTLLGHNRQRIATMRKQVPSDHGQRQKALEALYVAMLAEETPDFPPLLFNMVLSRVNIQNATQIMEKLEKRFPKALVNPYPNQEAFHGGTNFFTPHELKKFEELVDQFIERTKAGGRIVKRLPYWLLMKAVCTLCRTDPVGAARLIAGYGIWQCYRPNAGRYLQIGRSVEPTEQLYPGGHLTCFWEPKTLLRPQITSSDDVVAHLHHGMQHVSKLAGERACPGCAMPRLTFDMLTLESGMHPDLRSTYLDLRKLHAGF